MQHCCAGALACILENVFGVIGMVIYRRLNLEKRMGCCMGWDYWPGGSPGF